MHRPPARRHAFAAAIAAASAVAVPAAHGQSAAPAASAANAANAGDGTQHVEINASADASAGGLKPAYPGGQVARGGRVGILGSEDVMDTPFTITNYTQALVQDQQAQSIADVLLNDPGVRVARGFGNFQQTYIVRGLPVYSDDMSYNGLYGLLPRQYLAAELVERVEVLRGASAFLNGAAPGGSGLGGAVNVAPKRAPNTPLSEVTLGTETGGQVYTAVDLARRFGDDKAFGLRLSAANRDGDPAVHGENDKLDVGSIGADWHSGTVRVSADLGSQDFDMTAATPSITIAAGVPVPSAPGGRTQIAQPWTFSKENDLFGTLRTEVDLTPAITAWAAGGFRDGRESASFANPTVTAADGTDTAYRFDNTRHDIVHTGELGVRGKFATGSVGHTVVLSGAAYSLKSENAYAFSNFAGVGLGTIYDTTVVTPPDPDYFIGGDLGSPLTTQRTRTSSVAIADTLSMLDDRLLLTLGARHQHFGVSTYDYNSGALQGDASSGRTTPVAGLVFKAAKQLSLFANYIEGLVAGDIAPATSGSVVIRNAGAAMAPYQTKQAEIGAKWDLGHFGGVLSLYNSRQANAEVTDVTTGTDGSQTGTYSEGNIRRNKGAELSFYGLAMPGLRVLGGATFMKSTFEGTDYIGTPKSQFNVDADWDVPGVSGLSLDARLIHTASQFADQANTQVVPAWTRLDLGSRYVFDVADKPVTVRARINNISGRKYWASAGGYPGAGYLTVGEPRTLVVSGTVSF